MITCPSASGSATRALQKVGLDSALHSGATGRYVDRVAPDTSPSKLIGKLAYWFIFLGALAIAVSQLGIAALDNFVAAIGAYLPNIVAAVLIFVVQNFTMVTMSFLGFSARAPLALLAALAYGLGMATGGSLWSLLRRSFRRASVVVAGTVPSPPQTAHG